MRISLLVPIIDPSIVNKFTDIPLWYICNYFFSPGYGEIIYSWCLDSGGTLYADADLSVRDSCG